ncbi:c-type cytochrome [Paucimonas lemoignei]|nr:c-type cytochrome [Paucimonas lemoignei]
MAQERLYSLRNPWFVGALSIVVGIGLLAGLVGFIWMPYRQAGGTLSGAWDAICRAAGAPALANPDVQLAPSQSRPSEVILIPRMVATDTEAVGRGGTLALRCTMCHGVRGMSGAESPSLAGQGPEVIYKQLRDYQSGHRVSQIMAPHARNLSDQDMRDLGAYYASLPRVTAPPSVAEQLRAPAIVQIGAPMRNIAPCISCHGGSDLKTAAPLLDGAPASYLRNQMLAFAKGTRRNDLQGQMRHIARQMTPEEIEQVVSYYSQR